MMESIILVRHAEAEGGEGVFRGITDMKLTPEGLNQAEMLGAKMKGERIDRIYSSMLSRAVKTAEAIARPHKLEVIKTPIINEMNFGVFDGLTSEEARKRYPDIYEERGRDKRNYRIPGGGENADDAKKRVLPFIVGEAAKNRGKTLVFVTHRGIMKTLLGDMMKKSNDEMNAMMDFGCRVYLKHNGGGLRFERLENR